MRRRSRPAPRSPHDAARAARPDEAIVRSLADAIGDRTCALVHEWVAQRAGSELVFERLAQLLPGSELVTLSWEPGAVLDVPQSEVEVSMLDAGVLRGRRAATLAAMPWVWRSLGRSHDDDIVVSSSHAFARCFAETARPAVHLGYVHTPARYLWFPEADARAATAPAPLLRRLRAIDKRSARSAHLAANSAATGERVRAVYDRPSVVIPPPVDVDFFGGTAPASPSDRRHLLSVGRWIPYKRHDVAIEAAIRLGMPIVVAGGGPLAPRLQAMAGGSDLVRLCHNPNDAELRTLYRDAIALLYPAHEDFGIVPVEAQAAGTPVVALDVGGTRDSVIDGSTGIHVHQQSVDAFAAGVRRLVDEGIDPVRCQQHARTYSYPSFDERVRDWIIDAIS